MPEQLLAAVAGLLRELVDGPSSDQSFVVNPGDRGLLGSIRALSAAEASVAAPGRSSVAAHVDHVRFGLDLLVRWVEGEENPFADADFQASWQRQQVTEPEWRDRIDALDRVAHRWIEAVAVLRRPLDPVLLGGVIGSVAHTAYHLGAIRQIAAGAAGPRETH